MKTIDIQLALKKAGYDITADGIPGPRTTEAIKDFQKKHALSVDGDVGPLTGLALQKQFIEVVPIKNEISKPDKITLQRIEEIHPNLRNELRQIYSEICEALTNGLSCRFVQVYRSFEEQHAIFLQRPKVSNADAGQSYHNYGLAVDFVLLNDKNHDGIIGSDEIIWDKNTDIDKDKLIDWMEVVKIFQKYGWKWGGDWNKNKDYPHLEKTFGYNWRGLLDKYNKKLFIPGTTYVKL